MDVIKMVREIFVVFDRLIAILIPRPRVVIPLKSSAPLFNHVSEAFFWRFAQFAAFATPL